MSLPALAAAVRDLLDLGLMARDVAELLRAHPRAIEVLIVCDTERSAPRLRHTI